MIFKVVEEEDKFIVTIEKFILKFPKLLFYSNEDMWAAIDNGVITVGATDYFQTILSDILFLELEVGVGDEVTPEEEIGALESVKTVLDIFSPFTGKIIAVNDTLESSPEIVNKSAYQKGWIFKIEPSNLDSELTNLLTAEEYVQLIKEKSKKHYEREQRQKEI